MIDSVPTGSERFAKFFRVAVLLTALLLALRAPALGERFTERFEESYPVTAGAELSLGNTNGSVTVEVWDRATVEVIAEKSVDSRDAKSAREAFENVEIVVAESARALTIETRHPGMSSGLFDWLLGKARNASVRYSLRVPRDTRIEVRTVNGNVTTTGAGARQILRSTNGRIDIREARHGVDASTTNGSIEARVAAAPTALDVRLASTNGGLSLYLPRDAGGRVEAKTVNGSVKTDLPVTLRGGASRRSLNGEINGGGPGRIELRTTNGGIRIHAGSP